MLLVFTDQKDIWNGDSGCGGLCCGLIQKKGECYENKILQACKTKNLSYDNTINIRKILLLTLFQWIFGRSKDNNILLKIRFDFGNLNHEKLKYTAID